MTTHAAILVIDDDRLILQSCEDILKQEHYHPVLAASGEEGIQHIGSSDFDLIITDLKMRDKDGLDVPRCKFFQPKYRKLGCVQRYNNVTYVQ